jgi:hypothetical protein
MRVTCKHRVQRGELKGVRRRPPREGRRPPWQQPRRDKGAIDKHGRIDAIVNNSGIMPIAPMAPLKVDEWDRMIDVSIKGLLS